MSCANSGLSALVLGACLLVPASAGAGQGAESEPADVVRTELTLNLRPVAVSFETGLRAADPAHRELLAATESASGTRVRVGTIEALPRLRIGTLDGSQPGGSESPNPARTTLELWLARTAGGWSLDLRGEPDSGPDEADGDEAEESETGQNAAAAGRDSAVIGQVPLTRDADGAQETLAAALVPTGEAAGQLVLRWSDHRWTADFHLAEPPESDEDDETPEPEEEEEEGPRVANERESLPFDADTSALYRLARLAERHASTIEIPGGKRLEVLFWQEQSVDLADFAAVAALADGEVLRLTQAAVLRLRNEVPLSFGDAAVPTGNLAPGFAGSYGLWLKRHGNGWRLVFNHEADSWGTQHDPAFDAFEVDLAYSQGGLGSRPLGAALTPVAAGAGRLVIHWGPHEWVADYTVTE
ncbi:MAG: DUF2911 domain-containing protein [Acidobacteria bacterium]|nr:DUF2911 domain-containing protein [Acidobacteriota bacterium]